MVLVFPEEIALPKDVGLKELSALDSKGFRPIHYLGSKLRLLPEIERLVDELDPSKGRVCDLFSGSGTVSYFLSRILNSARDEEAGGLNLALQKIGLGFLQNDWYVSEKGAMYAMALPAIWQMSGYVLALFLAGFRGIPDDMREAARVDGASESQIYRYVLFPQLTPTLLTILIILGHISMKAFDLIIGINGKSYVTQVVAVYMWESTFDSRDYAKGTAIAIVLLIMIAIVVVPYLRYNSKQQAYR